MNDTITSEYDSNGQTKQETIIHLNTVIAAQQNEISELKEVEINLLVIL